MINIAGEAGPCFSLPRSKLTSVHSPTPGLRILTPNGVTASHSPLLSSSHFGDDLGSIKHFLPATERVVQRQRAWVRLGVCSPPVFLSCVGAGEAAKPACPAGTWRLKCFLVLFSLAGWVSKQQGYTKRPANHRLRRDRRAEPASRAVEHGKEEIETCAGTNISGIRARLLCLFTSRPRRHRAFVGRELAIASPSPSVLFIPSPP